MEKGALLLSYKQNLIFKKKTEEYRKKLCVSTGDLCVELTKITLVLV